MLDRPLSECLDRAIARLPQTCSQAPAAAEALLSWISRLSPTGNPRDYYDGGRVVMFVLPWWLEKRIRPTPDLRFQQQLVDSTVSAYYFVRLIDNVMDEDGVEERRLLPLLAILHSNFVRAYAELFPAGAPFWDHFDRYWSATVEATIRDKALTQLSADDFAKVAARKASGVKVPMAAVCCHYSRLDLLEPWCAFYDQYACWLQMANDTFDWVRDLRDGNVTFFLSEGSRQRRDGESVPGWVVRRGFAWGIHWLEDTMRNVRRHAEGLSSPELVRFLDYRESEARQQGLELGSQLKELVAVADVFEPIATESRSPDRH